MTAPLSVAFLLSALLIVRCPSQSAELSQQELEQQQQQHQQQQQQQRSESTALELFERRPSKSDLVSGILDYVEQAEREVVLQPFNCSRQTLAKFHYDFKNNLSQHLSHLAQRANEISTMLNNLLIDQQASSSSSSAMNAFRDLCLAIVKSTLQSSPKLEGVLIAFETSSGGGAGPGGGGGGGSGSSGGSSVVTSFARRTKAGIRASVDNSLANVASSERDPKEFEWYQFHTSTASQQQQEQFNDSQNYWTEPYFLCNEQLKWIISYSTPFYRQHQDGQRVFRGVVRVDINLHQYDINQCEDGHDVFSETHKCKKSTKCVFQPGHGFRRGGYICQCQTQYYLPNDDASLPSRVSFNGTLVEEEYLRRLHGQVNNYSESFECSPCAKGCENCVDASPCVVAHSHLIRWLIFTLTAMSIVAALVGMALVFRLRKARAFRSSIWSFLEIILVGCVLIYMTVIINCLLPTELTCIIYFWFREIGFILVYGPILLKLYKHLSEFKTRKAHRVQIHATDLLKYLFGMIVFFTGTLIVWTFAFVDESRVGVLLMIQGRTSDLLAFNVCKIQAFDFVVEIEELLFLCYGVYYTYSARKSPNDYNEKRFSFLLIYIELVVSLLLYTIRHFLWQSLHPDYMLALYFVRSQLTVTTVMILMAYGKVWYTHRPPDEDRFRSQTGAESQEMTKLQTFANFNGDLDAGEINFNEMSMDDVRSELKRLYTQLHQLKTKSMCQDNPHIPKRRQNRRTNRRFSLQAFQHKHRPETSTHDNDSRTPEESVNSHDGYTQAEEESHDTISPRSNKGCQQ